MCEELRFRFRQASQLIVSRPGPICLPAVAWPAIPVSADHEPAQAIFKFEALGSCHKRQKTQAPENTSANAASANP